MFQRGRQDERLRLKRVIELWNASRLDLFEITEPDEVSSQTTAGQGWRLQTNFLPSQSVSTNFTQDSFLKMFSVRHMTCMTCL